MVPKERASKGPLFSLKKESKEGFSSRFCISHTEGILKRENSLLN